MTPESQLVDTAMLRVGFAFGLSLSFVSWMVGIIGHALLQRTSVYDRLTHLQFIPSRAVNRALGIAPFRWLVKHSVFRYLNQSIRVDGRRTDLTAIRAHMTVAELSHLIGFVFVAAFAVSLGVTAKLGVALVMMIPNVLLNGYPVLLQQENKRRIDALLDRQARRRAAS